jgi:glutaredoxin
VIYIYGSRSCAFCSKAKALAAKHYGDYEFLDIGITLYYNRLKELNVSTNVQPQIFEDDRYIGTYYHLVKETQYRMEQQ